MNRALYGQYRYLENLGLSKAVTMIWLPMSFWTAIPEGKEWCGAHRKGVRTNLHRWLLAGESRGIRNLLGVNQNIPVYKSTESLQLFQVEIWASSIRILDSNVMNSRTVYDCRRCLNEICITWAPGHRNIPDNSRADNRPEGARSSNLLKNSLHQGSLWVSANL